MSSSDNNAPQSQVPKPSGLKAPSKLVRPSVQKLSSTATTANSSTTSTASTTIGNGGGGGMTSALGSASNSTSSLNNTISSAITNQTTTNNNTGGEVDESSLLNEFKLNDRIWVNGTKPGVIAFIGETQFKEGLWAGIILDTAEGKNNGTLNGVTYFNTEENRGVFCRLSKLTKTPQQASNLAAPSTTSMLTSNENTSGLKVGDRVLINSSVGGPTKIGILRYIGSTDFAKGEWAGVELEEKVGKNDGSVAGKRYFKCEPLYGVFAPVGKVELFTQNKVASTSVTPQQTSRLQQSIKSSPLKSSKLCKQFSGSQESLVSEKSSIYSTASSALKNRTSLLASQKAIAAKSTTAKNVPQTPIAATVGASAKKTPVTQPVLQQSLKEKEGHIAQLLKERDFERAEFTRAAQKFEQTESKLIEQTRLIQEKDQEIIHLNELIASLENSKSSFIKKQDEQRTRIEDLEFQIDELKLGCVKNEEEKQSIETLTTSSSNINEEENLLMKQLQLQKEIHKNHLEEIKFLKEQIDTLNIDLKQLRLGEEVYTQEKRELKKRLDEMETQYNIFKKDAEESYQLKDQVKDLELKLKYVNDESESNLNKLNANLAELSNQLQAAESQKSEIEFLYEEANVKLGDLNFKLDDKNKEIIHLRNELTTSKQSLLDLNQQNNSDDLEFSLEEQKALVQELETKLTKENEKHQNELKKLNDLINDLNNQKSSLESSKATQISELESRIIDLNEQITKLNDLEKEYSNFKQQKESELANLNAKLTNLSELNDKNSNEKEQNFANLKAEYEEFKLKNEAEVNKLNEEVNIAKKDSENKCKQLELLLEESKALNTELQTRITELIQNSGDYSMQLTSINESMKEKEKLIESLKVNITNLETQLNKENESNLKIITDKDEKIRTLESNFAELKLSKDTNINELNDVNKKLQEKCKQVEVMLSESKNVNQELETRINELIHNSGDYSLQLTSLNENLKEKEKQIEQLQSNLASLELQLSNLNESSKKKLDEKDETFAQLQNEYLKFKQDKELELNNSLDETKSLKDKYNKLETVFEETKASNNELQSRINELIQNSGDYSLQLTNLNESIKEKEKLIETLQSTIYNLETQLRDINDLNKNSNDKLKEAHTNINTLVQDNKNLIEKLNELTTKINNLNNDLEDKNVSNTTQQNELINLNKKISEQEAKIKEIQLLNEKLKSENENRLKSGDENTKQIEILNEEKIDLTKQIETAKLDLSKIMDLNQSNETKLNELAQQINLLTNQKQDLLTKTEILTNEKESIEINLKSALSDKDSFEVQLKTALLNKESLETQLKTALTNKESLESELKTYISARDTLESELKSAQSAKDSIESQLKLALAKNESLESQLKSSSNNESTVIEQLRKDLNESNLKILNMEDKSKQIQQDYEITINDLRQMITQNEETNEAKTSELNEFKAQFNEMETELNNHKDLIAEYEAENEQLRQEIERIKLLKEMNQSTNNDSHSANNSTGQTGTFKLASQVKPAPRLFCDICDEFDLHDTEDCPQQSMPEHTEKQSHTQYNAVKSSNRAYCDICEEFGHDEDNCPNANKTNSKNNLSDEEF